MADPFDDLMAEPPLSYDDLMDEQPSILPSGADLMSSRSVTTPYGQETEAARQEMESQRVGMDQAEVASDARRASRSESTGRRQRAQEVAESRQPTIPAPTTQDALMRPQLVVPQYLGNLVESFMREQSTTDEPPTTPLQGYDAQGNPMYDFQPIVGQDVRGLAPAIGAAPTGTVSAIARATGNTETADRMGRYVARAQQQAPASYELGDTVTEAGMSAVPVPGLAGRIAVRGLGTNLLRRGAGAVQGAAENAGAILLDAYGRGGWEGVRQAASSPGSALGVALGAVIGSVAIGGGRGQKDLDTLLEEYIILSHGGQVPLDTAARKRLAQTILENESSGTTPRQFFGNRPETTARAIGERSDGNFTDQSLLGQEGARIGTMAQNLAEPARQVRQAGRELSEEAAFQARTPVREARVELEAARSADEAAETTWNNQRLLNQAVEWAAPGTRDPAQYNNTVEALYRGNFPLDPAPEAIRRVFRELGMTEPPPLETFRREVRGTGEPVEDLSQAFSDRGSRGEGAPLAGLGHPSLPAGSYTEVVPPGTALRLGGPSYHMDDADFLGGTRTHASPEQVRSVWPEEIGPEDLTVPPERAGRLRDQPQQVVEMVAPPRYRPTIPNRPARLAPRAEAEYNRLTSDVRQQVAEIRQLTNERMREVGVDLAPVAARLDAARQNVVAAGVLESDDALVKRLSRYAEEMRRRPTMDFQQAHALRKRIDDELWDNGNVERISPESPQGRAITEFRNAMAEALQAAADRNGYGQVWRESMDRFSRNAELLEALGPGALEGVNTINSPINLHMDLRFGRPSLAGAGTSSNRASRAPAAIARRGVEGVMGSLDVNSVGVRTARRVGGTALSEQESNYQELLQRLMEEDEQNSGR